MDKINTGNVNTVWKTSMTKHLAFALLIKKYSG